MKDRPTGPIYGEEKSLTFILSLLKRERKEEPPRGSVDMRAECEPLPISQGQKSFVRDLIVFDGIDADLGHLHSFL